MQDRDEKHLPPDLETDPRFPSGPWIGFWIQRTYAARQWMRLFLVFKDGIISGEGCDCVGDFDMRGTYDLISGKCSIHKAYRGAHAVFYDGQNDGDGLWIWGLWHIRAFDRGGFHLWPEGEEDPTGRKLRAEDELPADADERPIVRLEPVETPA